MKLKMITLLLAVCLVCSLAACKAKKENTGTTPESQTGATTTTEAQNTDKTEAQSDDETEAEVATDSNGEPEEFKDAPDIIIPSEDDKSEPMEPQEDIEIEIEEGQRGSL